jgi:hypothetical protein
VAVAEVAKGNTGASLAKFTEPDDFSNLFKLLNHSSYGLLFYDTTSSSVI